MGKKSIELEDDVTKKNISKIKIKSVIEDILKFGFGLFFELKFISYNYKIESYSLKSLLSVSSSYFFSGEESSDNTLSNEES